MEKQIKILLDKNDITIADIEAAAFGLAGVDVQSQRIALENIVSSLGFKNFVVDNDGFLGIKAGLPKGYGVSCVNGTGTVVVGVDENGKRLQIGGIGFECGDEAGGAFIFKKVIRAAYDALYRLGDRTMLEERVMKLLGIDDKALFMDGVSRLYSTKFSHTPFIEVLFECLESGDPVSREIVEYVALNLAKSTAGCIVNLEFKHEVDIVLVGSVWVKLKADALLEPYKKHIKAFTGRKCNYFMPEMSPSVGAIIWATELSNGGISPSLREKIIKNAEKCGNGG